MKNHILSLENKISEHSEMLLIILLLLFFATEAINKVSLYSYGYKGELQSLLKGVVLGTGVIVLSLRKSKVLIYILVLSVIFMIGQYTLANNFEWKAINYFIKYIFALLLFTLFLNQPGKPKYKLLRIYEFLLIFNSILVFIGLLFHLQFLQSYIGNRFGYNGLILTTATGTYFYIIGIIYFFIRYQREVVKKWGFWFICAAGLIIGTKSIVLALTVLGVFYIIKYIGSRNFKLWLLLLIILIALSFGYYLFFVNPLFLNIQKSRGLLTSVLSLRDQLFLNYTLPYIQEYWSTINYFFGGVSDFELRPQLELIDLFFFWGIVGAVFYIYFYLKCYLHFDYKKQLILFVLILLLFISFLAGNFFYNASVPIYLIILREAINLYLIENK